MFILNASVKCNRYFLTSSKHGRITTSKIQFYLFIITASCQDWICNYNCKKIRRFKYQTYTFLASGITKFITCYKSSFNTLRICIVLKYYFYFHDRYLDKNNNTSRISTIFIIFQCHLWVSWLYSQTKKANLPKLFII